MTCAALFVEERGVYADLGVDVWGVSRDARTYNGSAPVVAHPPCERWGRYWSGGPSAKERRRLGDDGGCFASALASVRRCGGVLEHPEASHAWRAFGLHTPPMRGGWIVADDVGGWACCVSQYWYGHPARKATWLYARGVVLPSLRWGMPAPGVTRRLDPGYHTAAERKAVRARRAPIARLSRAERVGTPLPFALLLLSVAAST